MPLIIQPPRYRFEAARFLVQNGYAPEWAVVNYTMFRLSGNTFLTVRNEYFNDKVGSRTGFATDYSEHSIGITWWPDKPFDSSRA